MLDLAADWADISQGLRGDLGQQLHSQWIKPIQLGSFCKETGTPIFTLPTEFSANCGGSVCRPLAGLEDRPARCANVRIRFRPGAVRAPGSAGPRRGCASTQW